MARIRFSRSTCQISGTYVPVAEMELHDDDWVYFSHHVLLHTEPRVKLESLRMQGGWNRIMAGMPLIMMRAQGPGFVGFSADHPGEVLAIPLEPNQGVDVVEHRFLLATGNIGYQWHKLQRLVHDAQTATRQSGTTRSAGTSTGSSLRAVLAC